MLLPCRLVMASANFAIESMILEIPKGTRVLVLDDDRFCREVLLDSLNDSDCAAVGIANVREALKAVPIFQPQIIFSDIGMPEEDGFCFLEKLRQQNPQHVPVIAVTGSDFSEEQILAAGFAALLRKPVTPLQLLTAVQSNLKTGPSN
jgi:CheY-like chemotaxis protein